MGKVESPGDPPGTPNQEEERQIYRIQRFPGKQGGFDALTYSEGFHMQLEQTVKV